jgi:hypothetical protein
MKLPHHLLVASLLIIASSTASAAVTLYQGGGDHSDTIDEARNAFIAGTTSTNVEDFETTFSVGASIDFPVGGPTEFTATGTNSPNQSSSYAISGDYTLNQCSNGAGETVTFTFVSPITTFGTDIRDVADSNNILNFSLNTGDAGTATTQYNTYHHEFFGLTSTTPFTSITFTWTSSGDCVYWEDLRYGDGVAIVAEAVNVPVTSDPLILILMTGLIGLAAFRQFRRV